MKDDRRFREFLKMVDGLGALCGMFAAVALKGFAYATGFWLFIRLMGVEL